MLSILFCVGIYLFFGTLIGGVASQLTHTPDGKPSKKVFFTMMFFWPIFFSKGQ